MGGGDTRVHLSEGFIWTLLRDNLFLDTDASLACIQNRSSHKSELPLGSRPSLLGSPTSHVCPAFSRIFSLFVATFGDNKLQ